MKIKCKQLFQTIERWIGEKLRILKSFELNVHAPDSTEMPVHMNSNVIHHLIVVNISVTIDLWSSSYRQQNFNKRERRKKTKQKCSAVKANEDAFNTNWQWVRKENIEIRKIKSGTKIKMRLSVASVGFNWTVCVGGVSFTKSTIYRY